MKWKNTAILFLVFFVSVAIYALFVRSVFYKELEVWVRFNRVYFVIFLFTFKFLSILWPPLTGGLATLAAIPFIGWPTAYFADFLGSISGGVVAYMIGKKYGYTILSKLFDDSIVEKIRNIKVIKKREFEALIIYRIIFGWTIVEAIYYGAGVLRMSFRNFIVASVVSHLAMGVPTFYLTSNFLTGTNLVLSIVSIIVAVPLFLKLRKRHFEL